MWRTTIIAAALSIEVTTTGLASLSRQLIEGLEQLGGGHVLSSVPASSFLLRALWVKPCRLTLGSRRDPLLSCPPSCVIIASQAARLNPGPLGADAIRRDTGHLLRSDLFMFARE